MQVITFGHHREMFVTDPYFNIWRWFQVKGEMVIVSRHVEIAAGSMIVPIKLGDNEKCPFCDSNHFLLLVDFV